MCSQTKWCIMDVHLSGSATIVSPEEELPPEHEAVFRVPDRLAGDTCPLLALSDRRGRVRNWHTLFAWGYWRGMVALCSGTTPPE